jgi:hypothetical protein
MLAPQLHSWQAKTEWDNGEAHAAPSHETMKAAVLVWVQGVQVIQRLLAIQTSCKSATQSLIDFTIQFLAKTQTLKTYRAPNGLRYPLVGGTR